MPEQNFYGFAPIFPIMRDEESKAYYGELFSKIEYMGEISLVAKLPFGAISVYLITIAHRQTTGILALHWAGRYLIHDLSNKKLKKRAKIFGSLAETLYFCTR